MLDAVEFLQERNRRFMSGAATPSIGLEDDYDPVIAVKVVEKWSAEHPHKTRQDVFLEQWPEAELTKDGAISICPIAVSAAYRNKTGGCASPTRPQCAVCRREFWMQEVE